MGHLFQAVNSPGLSGDIDQAVLHARFSHDGLHLACNVVEAVVSVGRYVDSLLRFPYLNNRIKFGNL